MKLKLKAGIILGLLTLLGVAARPIHAAPPAGYTLLWDDEFSSTTNNYTGSPDLNETLGSPPDPAFWSYDTGNNGGWGNNEIETYTTTNAAIVTDVNAANGTALDINAFLSGGSWTSARIKTQNSSVIGTQPQYGYFESQIEAPIGSGLWPAWWMMGEDLNTVGWPEAGEMDLFEQFEVDPTNEFSTDHYGTTSDAFSIGNSITITDGQYNVYGLLWTPTVEANYLNGYNTNVGEPYNSQNLGGAFNQPFFFLYNLAVGSAGSPSGSTGSNTGNSADLRVGYIRVYQPTGHLQTASNAVNNSPTLLAGGSHPVANGTYQVTPQSSAGTRLDLTANGTGNGNGIDAAASTAPTTASEAWTFSTTGVTPAGDYNISADGPYCLQAGGWFPGTYAEIWGCDGNSLQSWNVVTSGSDYQIQMAAIPPLSEETPAPAALCLTDMSGIMQLEACSTATSDEFTILPLTPAGPTGLAATAAAGGVAPVTLNWTASAGAFVYRVYRSTTSGGEANPALAGGIATTSYTDTSTLTKGATYYYKVTAVSAGGASPFSNEASVTLAPAAPAAPLGPIGLTATASAGGVNPVSLAWTASTGATGYQVFRGTVQIGATGASPTTFSDSGAAAGIANSYTVTAVNTGGTSPASNVASVTLAPAAPTLTGTVGNNENFLNWTASAGATVYRVYRSTTSGGEANPVLAGGLATTSYTDTAAVNGATYYYKVTAVNTAGASPYSNEVSENTGSTAPLAPTGLTATASAGGVGPVTLHWTASVGATVYRVYRSTISHGEANPALAGGIGTTSYTDTSTLTAGTTYYYEVTAVSTGGASPFSNEANVVITPAPPTNLAATATAGAAPVTLNWTASAGATGYNVFRGTVSLGSTGATTFSDTTVVAAGVVVSYTVTATNAGGTSAASNTANALLKPASPTGLTATAGNNEVVLNWNASTGATVYRVYRATTSGGEGNPALVGGLATPSYTDTAAVNGTTYYYEVTAVSTAGASGFSTEASATPHSSAPSAPTLLTATAAANGVGPITLTWSSSAGATVYRVYRSTTSGGEANPALAGGITATAYTDTSTLTQGITYYYEVTAVNGGGASGFSNQLSVLLSPRAATGLTATASAGGTAPVTLAWTAGVGATGYNVFRGTANIGSTGTTGFSDSTVVPAGVNVSYTVVGVNGAGASPASGAASVLLQPAAPINLQATAGVNEVTLSWNSSPGATIYRVYRSTTAGGETAPALVGGLGIPGYIDLTAVNGTTYYYKVTAANAAGASGYSNEASADPGSIAAPTNLTATAAALGTSPITLNWTGVAGATFYRVYRSTVSNGEGGTALAVGITSTTYSDGAASAGLTYYYKVTAVNNIGASAFSNEAGATLTPANPSSLSATGGSNSVTLNWNASIGTTSYGIYRGNGSGLETLLTTSASPTYVDNSAVAGATYYYKVNATNAGGTSGYSNEVHLLPSPSAPSSVTASTATANADQTVDVSWTASIGATSYNIYRATRPGGEGVTAYATGVSGTSYTDTSASQTSYPGVTYYYKVAAVNTGGTSAQSSSEGSADPCDTSVQSDTPSSFTAQGNLNTHTINLAWSLGSSDDANLVELYQSATSDATHPYPAGAVNHFPNSTTSYGVFGYVGTLTYYALDERDACGVWSNAPAYTTVPVVPTGLSGTGRVSSVVLIWNAANGATAYNVYRATASGGEGGTPYATGITTTAYTDLSAASTATYYYTVTGVNGSGESGQSTEITVPAAPVASITSAPGAAPIVVSWTASPGATSYTIARGTTPSETFLASSAASPYTDTAVVAGVTYYYTVAALAPNASSYASNQVSATVTAAPSPPAGVTANTATVDADQAVGLSWSASGGATGYNIYRSTTSGGETLYDTTSTTSYTDTAATQTTYGAVNYYYTVTAVNTGGESAQSGESTAANPCDTSIAGDIPTNASLTMPDETDAELSWTNGSSDDIGSFNLWSNTQGTPYADGDFDSNDTASSTTALATINYTAHPAYPTGSQVRYDIEEVDLCGQPAHAASADATAYVE